MVNDLTDPAANQPQETLVRDVVRYLEHHPEFFKQHPHLMLQMDFPLSMAGDNVVDFQNYLVKRLREELAQSREHQLRLVRAVKANASIQQRILDASLHLMQATSLAEAIHRLMVDVPKYVGVDRIIIGIEASPDDFPLRLANFLRPLPSGWVRQQFSADEKVVLREDVSGDEVLYGSGYVAVRSDALARLDIMQRGAAGILAFGANQPGAFDLNQATDLLVFLTHVVEIVLRQWLRLPSDSIPHD